MKFTLTDRMKRIISLCETVDTIVDVGTDHGKIAIELANLKISKNVIATDIKPGPLDSCKNNAKMWLNVDSSNFTTLLCDGLSNVDKSLETGIIIAGMGFDAIKEILKDINSYNFKYLILSPHTKVTDLIKFIESIKLKIVKISSVFEDDKAYFIMKVTK